ncbi:MAG: hypothetical protein U1E76_22975 [Planctomycetota bacterium]
MKLPVMVLLVGAGFLPLRSTLGTTYLVGGPGSQFEEIQPAIDAAKDGDVILVRPLKRYQGFTLTKGITVRSSQGRFTLTDDADIEILLTAKQQVARLAGVEAIDNHTFLHVHDCAGPVVIDDVLVAESVYSFTSMGMLISHCDDVHLTQVNLAVTGDYLFGYCPFFIWASRVQLVDVDCRGGDGWSDPYFDGNPTGSAAGAGLACVYGSSVVLAAPILIGGTGGKGGDGCGSLDPHGGKGGDGLVVDGSSQVLVLGTEQNAILGGKGGDGQASSDGCPNTGGDGGAGVVGAATVSGVALAGGAGGSGQGSGGQDGNPGPPVQGSVTFIDPPYPVLQLTGDLHPGSTAILTLRGEPGAAVVLLLASTAGWLDLPPGLAGAPLEAIPGGAFLVLPVGGLPASGALTFAAVIPGGATLRGAAFTVQAVVFGAGVPMVSNGATRIIGE